MSYNPLASGTPTISRSTARVAANNTGSLIPKCIPVKATAFGMDLMDPSNEADVDSLGVTKTSIIDGGSGDVVTSGLIEDCGLAFAAGDVVYVSASGGTTNTKPSPGVNGFAAGDFVIRLGVITLNTNPSLRDLILSIQITGQL